jgi:hypothetical protein
MRPPAPGECGFCAPRPEPATEHWTDEFGYTYHLCRAHYVTLVSGLVRIEARRLARSRVRPGTGAQAIHPDVQEAIISVLAETLAEQMLSGEEAGRAAAVARSDREDAPEPAR